MYKRLVPSHLHELHVSKLPSVLCIEFIRSKLLLIYPGSQAECGAAVTEDGTAVTERGTAVTEDDVAGCVTVVPLGSVTDAAHEYAGVSARDAGPRPRPICHVCRSFPVAQSSK